MIFSKQKSNSKPFDSWKFHIMIPDMLVDEFNEEMN